MMALNRERSGKPVRPVRILQFGEGNFLRGFVDEMVDIANEKGVFDGSVAVVKPIQGGSLEAFRRQDCQYTVLLRGSKDGAETERVRVVGCIADVVDAYREYDRYATYATLETLRFVVSNTTEAGIVYDEADRLELSPPRTFPGKLTKLLFERYRYFKGAGDKGLVMLPVELIEENGGKLRECVLRLASHWGLEQGFARWVEEACIFCSTLVDRIITGFPRAEAETLWERFGYRDELLVTGEPFALWVVEGPQSVRAELPLDQAGLPVVFTEDQSPYRERKVRILNGAHTSFSLAAFLAGCDDVCSAIREPLIRGFVLDTIFQEIIPTLTLPRAELEEFAHAVLDRFQNPYIRHELLAISLNSVSKWRARCLPSVLAFMKQTGRVPERLAFSLAALAAFYSGREAEGAFVGERNGETYRIQDDAAVLAFFARNAALPAGELTRVLLANEAFFGEDLTVHQSLAETVASALEDIRALGMREAMGRRFGGGAR